MSVMRWHFGCLAITISFMSAAIASSLENPNLELFKTFPRTPGYGPFTMISQKAPLEVAPGPGGESVLLLGRRAGSSGNDLDYHFGVDFSQKVEILTDESNLFALGARGRTREGETIFSFIHNNTLQVLRIPEEASPQGDPFTIHQVSADGDFWSCDHFVTPAGEILVLGYYASNVFQPRLFLDREGSGVFQEIDLGLNGVYLDAVFGSPRMRLVPHLYDGNVIYFWAIRQFTQEESKLVIIGVDLDAVGPADGNTRGPAQGPVISEEDITNLPAANPLVPDGDEETAASPVGRGSDLAAMFFFWIAESLNAGFYHPKTGASLVQVLPSGTILRNQSEPVGEFQNVISTFPGEAAGAVVNVTVKAGLSEYSYFVDGPGTWEDPAQEVVLWERMIENENREEADEGWLSAVPGNSPIGPPIKTDRVWFFTGFRDQGMDVFGVRKGYLGESLIAPHLALGATSVQLVNIGPWPVTSELYVTDQDDNALQTTQTEIPPYASFCFDVGGPLLQAGAGYILSDYPVQMQVTWKLSDHIETPNAGGPGVTAHHSWWVPIQNDSDKVTSVAAVNTYNGTNPCAWDVYDQSGGLVTSEIESFDPGQQTAFFTLDRFSGLEMDFKGALNLTCEFPVAATGATQEEDGDIVLTPALAEQVDRYFSRIHWRSYLHKPLRLHQNRHR